MRLIPVALLMILPSASPYVDCRTACRTCHEQLEPEQVLEVHCSMCTECKERRKEKLAIRLGSESTTQAIRQQSTLDLADESNIEDTDYVSIPAGCPTSPPCSESDEMKSAQFNPACPPIKACKKKLINVVLPPAPPPYYPPYYHPPAPPCFGGCMPPPPYPPLPPLLLQQQLQLTTKRHFVTTTKSTTTERPKTSTTTTTEPPQQLMQSLAPPLPPYPIHLFQPQPPPQPCLSLPFCGAPYPGMMLVPGPAPYNPSHFSATPTHPQNGPPSSTSADYLYMFVGVPKNVDVR